MSETLRHVLVVPLTARTPIHSVRRSLWGAEDDYINLPICVRADTDEMTAAQEMLLDMFGQEMARAIPITEHGYHLDDLVVIIPPKAGFRFWEINWGMTYFTAKSLPEVLSFYYARKRLKTGDWICLSDLIVREVTDIQTKVGSPQMIIRVSGYDDPCLSVHLKLAAPNKAMLEQMLKLHQT